MFGPKLRIEYDGFGVSLVPIKKEWLDLYAEKMSSLDINMYTNGLFGYVREDEEEWYNRNREDKDCATWAIVPDGCELPVGTTSIHGINKIGGCHTGIIIFEKSWWGRGVASRAHLIRTWYASDMLARMMIESSVRVDNHASRKALERVGYVVVSDPVRNGYRNGKYIDTYSLLWINPERVSILYPEGLPAKYIESVERARVALVRARQLVQLI